jgi:hypothetical protein
MYPNGVRLKENDHENQKDKSHPCRKRFVFGGNTVRTSVTLNCHVGRLPLPVPPTLCDTENPSKNIQCEEILDRRNAQASVQSPNLGSAWCIKAGLSYSEIVGSEGKRNYVSRRGSLKDGQLNIRHND